MCINVHVTDYSPALQALTEDDPLHIILDELGPPGKQLSYSMNATICLSLTNRWDHSKGMLCHCRSACVCWSDCACMNASHVRIGEEHSDLYSIKQFFLDTIGLNMSYGKYLRISSM